MFKDASEDFYDAASWYGEAFNPLNITDIDTWTTQRGLTQKAVAVGIPAAAVWGVYGLSGGGASHSVARSIARPTFLGMRALKIDNYRMMLDIAGRSGSTLLRTTRRIVPAVTAYTLGVLAITAVNNYLVNINPLLGIIPDANFMRMGY